MRLRVTWSGLDRIRKEVRSRVQIPCPHRFPCQRYERGGERSVEFSRSRARLVCGLERIRSVELYVTLIGDSVAFRGTCPGGSEEIVSRDGGLEGIGRGPLFTLVRGAKCEHSFQA
jgi:hypothetical protein